MTRCRHQDELDDIIAGWTSTQGQYQVMDRLQAVGVPAGPVLNARQLLADPQFHDRGFFESVQHPPETGLGRREYIGRGWKLSGNNLRIRGPAPRLGEANQYVLHDVLGRTERDIQELRQEEIMGEGPVGGGPPLAVPLERQVELGWIVERDEGHQPR
jgi:crotonobetainyl-CoA:carnitine CoA-transferase CaiB-like acyl-CoA transferase